MKRSSSTLLLLLAGLLVLPSAAQADFGFVPGSASAMARDAEGIVVTGAGSHPDSFTVEFELNQEGNGHTEGGEMRDVLVDLPPGFVGNPEVLTPCSRQQFEGGTPRCSGASQVGVARATVFNLGEAVNPVYLVEPGPGVPAQFGFSIFNWAPMQYASVRAEEGYGLRVTTPSLPAEVSSVSVTVWGSPAAKSHDPDRVCSEGTGGAIHGCPAGIASQAFLTMPTGCGPFETTIAINSKQDPGNFVTETVPLRNPGGTPTPIAGCEQVPFTPKDVTAATTTGSADSPSGFGFGFTLPGQGLFDASEIAESQPVKTELTLPQGMTVNPSAANGAGVCSSAAYRQTACPEGSKVGTIFARTPLLKEPIEGSVYLAAPHDNPFDSLIALYIVARVPERGILVKQAGLVRSDPVTGQLTSTFDHLPPVPYSSFEVKLRDGARAPLITPQTCGTYKTQVRFYPFSNPGSAVERTANFKVTSGAGGAGCASSEARLPNNPAFEAGTMAPLAGAFSPFVFNLSRLDGSQRFAAIAAMPPQGLTGKLAGVPYCSDPQIAAATARSGEGEGVLELVSPSCSAASQVGVANVTAGAGSAPVPVQGKVYLAGPYKGAPLSLAVITPGIAGPFDLGTVVVRTALYVNESTAQIRAVSDPLPTILAGIPLDVRSVSLQLNRQEFSLNPTNCEAMAVTGSATSTLGQTALLSNRFRVGGCKDLGFSPSLSLKLSGSTQRGKNPALRAVLTQPKGQANIARAQVTLPHSAFLDNAHIKTICTRVQFAAKACPAASVYGHAKAITPLLDAPLSGPVYLRSSSHKLPDLVADLNGQVEVTLAGRVDTGKGGGIRNTFEALPDAPVTKFTLSMQGGKKGLLVNSENICRKPQRAVVNLTAQSGKTHNTTPLISNSCPKQGKSKSKGAKKR